MKTTVRATRGYLAGFGTSGSLLAGAAALFVLGSAIVAFRGWPQVATGPATVVVAASHPAGPSRIGRRLAAVLRAGRVTGGAAPVSTAGGRATRRHRSPSGTGAPVGSPGSAGSPAAHGGSSSSAVTAGAVNSTMCASNCIPRSSPGLISQLTSSIAQEVSSVGSTVGSTVSSTSSGAAGPVNGASPQAGSAIQGTGASAGNAISGVSSTAASTVGQAGSTLSGGH